MPVEFLSDQQAATYEGYVRTPSPQELRRYFFLNDEDRKRRGDHNRMGFSLQLVTRSLSGDVPGRSLTGHGEERAHALSIHRWVVSASVTMRPVTRRPDRNAGQGAVEVVSVWVVAAKLPSRP